ncbi:zinc finger MYND domain-containing protein 15-like [Salminus brasiliensis]|uniref:zinc finger MYND domain-containing protein 15-like n=1 Tax=Salminus brasiliensis TaxID=930266 RepID=UPI003B830F24
MEFDSGYRDRLLLLSRAMADWHKQYDVSRSSPKKRVGREGRVRLPVDRTCAHWILHLLDCAAAPPAARARLNADASELVYEDGESVLLLTDSSGLPLGFDMLPQGWSSSLDDGDAAGGDAEGAEATARRMLELLRYSMEVPLSGGLPRRPRTLRVSDKRLHRLLSQREKSLSRLKVTLRPEAVGGWVPIDVDRETGAPCIKEFSMRWPPIYYCHACKKHTFPSQLKPCPGCKAALFCSDGCLPTTLSWPSLDFSRHHCCERLAFCMSHKAQLADLPFAYASETTAENFDLDHFLFKNKLDSGYWLHWSHLVRSSCFELRSEMEQSKGLMLSGHLEPYGHLKEEADILLSHTPHSSPSLRCPLVSWSQYFSWRGLKLASPVAPLLSSTLSIYYIITSLVPHDFPELNILKKQSLKIHIIESYREFHTLMSLWELSVLLPHMTFEMSFVGERLPLESDEHQLFLQKKSVRVSLVNPPVSSEDKVDKKSIRIKAYKRAYHMLQGPKPDLVIGFRPAIPLHDSWLSTLPRLQSLRVPAYFCELSELSCESSQQVMSSATGGALSPPTINPFHCPLRICGGDNLLPWYSNAFIFHLLYKALGPCPQRHFLTSGQAGGPPDPQRPTNQRAATAQQTSPPRPPKMTKKERKKAARNTPRKRK